MVYLTTFLRIFASHQFLYHNYNYLNYKHVLRQKRNIYLIKNLYFLCKDWKDPL